MSDPSNLSIEDLSDALVTNPSDVALRRALREKLEVSFRDFYPDVIESGIVLRASLLALRELVQ